MITNKDNTEKRINEILKVIQKVAVGDLNARSKVSLNRDIIDALATGLNILLDELRYNYESKNYINKRISVMLEIVQKVARGNYSIANKLSDNNDIFDALAVSINMMIDDIKNNVEGIGKNIKREKIINTLYSEIKGLPMGDLPKKIGVIINHLSKEFNAERISIMHIDNKTNRFKVLNSKGLYKKSIAYIENSNMEKASPVAHYVCQTRKEIIINSANELNKFKEKNKDFNFFKFKRKMEQAFISMPYTVLPLNENGTIIGAINICKKIKFSNWDKELIYTIKDLIAKEITEETNYLQIMEMEREKRQKDQMLTQMDKLVALGTLVSGVAHEINNPNYFIMSGIPVLTDVWEDIKPAIKHYFKNNKDFEIAGMTYSELIKDVPALLKGIKDGSNRISRITNELKEFASEKKPGISKNININHVVKAAATLLSSQIKKVTNNFSVVYGKNIPPVQGNFQRIEQVIINLILNACQAITHIEQSILIETQFEKAQKNIIVKVKDDGKGIAKEDLRYIMDPFFTTKRNSGGTGLGLSISANIIKEHGGVLVFDSERYIGTVAIIKIPVKESK